MTTVHDSITIHAHPAAVWDAIRSPATHTTWHPLVTAITGDHALGAVRSCDVLIKNRRSQTQETCTEYRDGERITWRIDRDTSGFSNLVTDWSAGFQLRGQDSSTVVTAQSTFTFRNALMGLMAPLIRRQFHGVQRAILASLKRHVERS